MAEDKSQEDDVPLKSSHEDQANDRDSDGPDPVSIDGNLRGTCPSSQPDSSSLEDVTVLDGEFSRQVESLEQLFVKRSENYSIPQLERLYTRIMKGVFGAKDKGKNDLKNSVLSFLLKFVEDDANF